METYLELTRDVIPSDEETAYSWDNITKEELQRSIQQLNPKLNMYDIT